MYDAPSNRFVEADKAEAQDAKREGRPVFVIGEAITLRGVDFVIFNVTDKNIILRCVKKNSVRKIA